MAKKFKVKTKQEVDEWLDEEISDDELGGIYDEADEYLKSMSRGSDREGEVNYETPSEVEKQAKSSAEKSEEFSEKAEASKKKYVIREPMRVRGSTEGMAEKKEMPADTKKVVVKKIASEKKEEGMKISDKDKMKLKALAMKGEQVVKKTREGTGRRKAFMEKIKAIAAGKIKGEEKDKVMNRLKKYSESKKKVEAK